MHFATDQAENTNSFNIFSMVRLRDLMLLVGQQEGHLASKKLSGPGLLILSGARCKFAYGLVDATVTHCLLLQ